MPITSEWRDDGPSLPLEFARVSADGRVTLVVCRNAVVSRSFWNLLATTDLKKAKRMLADREGISETGMKYSIAYWSKTERSKHWEASAVGDWAISEGISSVVWTGLKSGFPDARGIVPTYDKLLQHLEALEVEACERARLYIRNTPAQIKTSYRPRFERDLQIKPKA